MDKNCGVVVFSIVNELGAIVINSPNCFFDTEVNNTLDAC